MSAKSTHSEKLRGGGEGREEKEKRKSNITSEQKRCERRKKKFFKWAVKAEKNREIDCQKNKQRKIGEGRGGEQK